MNPSQLLQKYIDGPWTLTQEELSTLDEALQMKPETDAQALLDVFNRNLDKHSGFENVRAEVRQKASQPYKPIGEMNQRELGSVALGGSLSSTASQPGENYATMTQNELAQHVFKI